jgi:DNA modification methylase
MDSKQGLPSGPPWELWGAGRLACADCLEILPGLPAESLDLILIDPPFSTGKEQIGSGQTPPSYRDNWEGGTCGYVDWLMERIAPMRGLLKLTGSLVIHLDWHASHQVKVALDRVFGERHFQNEIVWYYQTGGASRRRFSRKHDTLLWYTRSKNWKFFPEEVKIPRTEKALHRARNPKGARISTVDTHKNPEDVLTIPALNPMSNERTGYPTQKPVELAEVFVKALTEPGDTVADFFCGSGTALVAAERWGRAWLGCDSSPEAIEIVKRRVGRMSGRA